MEKLTRSEKQKIIERVKTLIIAGLSVSCVFLGYHTFELYRDQSGDSLFWGSSENLVIEAPDESLSNNTNLKLSQPEILMINRVESRDLIRDSKEFLKASESVASVMYELNSISDEVYTEASITEWRNALKNNSVYARYPYSRDIMLETKIYENNGLLVPEGIQYYDELALVPDGKGEELSVFITDSRGENIIKTKIKTPIAVEIKSIIDSHSDMNSKKYTFAYELNLDRNSGAGNEKNEVALDSMFVIPTEKVVTEDIKVNVPRIYKNGLDFTKTTDFTQGLINIFGYNPNTVRQYASSDNALIFVGETGSLSVHPQGWIEYKSLGVNEGVQLSKPANSDDEFSSILSGMCKIIERIFAVSGVFSEYSEHTLKLVELSEKSDISTEIKVGVDYFVDGNKIEFGNSPAIEANISQGILTELKMQIKDVRKIGNKTELPPVFDAIDSYCEENPDVPKLLMGNVVYKFEENGAEISAGWKIKE